MTTFAEPTLLDGEEITTQQFGVHAGGHDFTYDLTHRASYEAEVERNDIIAEIISGDVYHLSTFTKPGDVWVDAGCHLGIFSIAAMMHGADVSVMLDMDSSAAWMAELNARHFLTQIVRRHLSDENDRQPRIRPTAFNCKVGSPYELVECGMLAEENWPGRRSCIKLDVQGAEMEVLALGGGEILADGFDRLVMEWHSPDIHEIDGMLGDRWQITGMKAHMDTLLHTNTHIVWAQTVDYAKQFV